MKITVTDANIFIDLIKLRWLGFLFSIDVEIYTCVEVADELKPGQYEELTGFIQSRQLKLYYFTSDELETIVAMVAPSSLSAMDKSVVFLAQQLKGAVLSGDNTLRKFCTKNNLEVRGMLWLFDRFVELELVTAETAIEKMELLLSFNNRLPVADCEQRLKEWKGK